MSPEPPSDHRRRTVHLAILLALIAMLQFGYPVTQNGPAWTAVYMVGYAVMLGAGIITVRDDHGRLVPMIVVTAVFLVCGTWFVFAQHSVPATVAMLTSVALAMAVLIYALLRFVFRRERAPGVNLVLAAVSAYLVMGGFFGASFALLEIAAPGSFMDPQGDGGALGWHQMLYFSFVSLSAIGYGDVLPATTVARSLGSFEGVFGTLYLTVVVARLVGIWSSDAEQRGE